MEPAKARDEAIERIPWLGPVSPETGALMHCHPLIEYDGSHLTFPCFLSPLHHSLGRHRRPYTGACGSSINVAIRSNYSRLHILGLA